MNNTYITKLKEAGYTYIKGYKGCESRVVVSCDRCNTIFIRNYHGLTKKRLSCPNCLENKYNATKEDTKNIYKLLEQQKEITKNKTFNAKAFAKYLKDNTLKISYCVVCGKEIIKKRKNRYCCKQCMEKAHRKEKEEKRYKAIMKRRRDYGISVLGLYRRDNGVCYICGGLCDVNDKETKIINGKQVIKCGNNYPSIDHVIPLAKGGTDTWDNIALAHRICNTIKGAKIPGGSKF